MLKEALKSLAHYAGWDIFRARRDPHPWSHTVKSYYPVQPKPRWKCGHAPYIQLKAVLDKNRHEYERFLSQLGSYREVLFKICPNRRAADHVTPYWNNLWFSGLDAASLVGLILSGRPHRYIEIGSGHSTSFARYAADAGSKSTEITSIDPHPRQEIDQLCDRVVRSPLEGCDLNIFDELQSGDILFFDGSHRIFTNSDVTVFFFEVLPRLKPGVLVHIHDIFVPDDYPEAWNERFYSEQYLLAMLLLAEDPRFRIVLPCHFVCTDSELKVPVLNILDAQVRDSNAPFAAAPPSSFWLQIAQKASDLPRTQ